MEPLVLAHAGGLDEIGMVVVILGIVVAFVLAERSSRRSQATRSATPPAQAAGPRRRGES